MAKQTEKFPYKYAQVAKNPFQDRHSLYSLANNRLMDITQLSLTWVGWPNGENLSSTCVHIWSRPKWEQAIASQRKRTHTLAKRSRKFTQVFNWCLLATPFGQGFIRWNFFVALICVDAKLFYFSQFLTCKKSLSLQNIKIGNFLTVVYSSLGDDLGIAVCPRSCHGYVLMPKFSFILKYSGLVFAALFCASEMNHI